MRVLLLLAGLLVTDPLQVTFYGEQCKLEATYAVDQVHISREGIITLYFEDGSRMDVPLKYTEEAQIAYGAYFRSYSWVDGKVVESLTPKCGGTI